MYLCTPPDSIDLLWGILFLEMLVSAAVMLSLYPQQ